MFFRLTTILPGHSTPGSGWRRARVLSPNPAYASSGGVHPPDLLQEGQQIAHTPMVGDLSIMDAHDIDCFEVDLAVGRSDAKERPFMRPVIRLISCHAFTVGKLPVNFRVEVRERSANIAVELPYTLLVRSRVRLRCMVNEIFGEKFFKHAEVSSTLHFFGISADNRFRRI